MIITNVKEDSIAYENELQQGDVIKEIDNEPIKSISDFKKAVKKQNLKDGALLLIERDKSSFYVVLTEK